MMMSDPKKLAVMIIGRRSKKSSYDAMKASNEQMSQLPSKDDEESVKADLGTDEQDMDAGLQSAAEDMISAIHSKDTAGLVDAMKDFVSMCDDYEDQDESSEDKASEE